MATARDFALKPHPKIAKPEGPLLVCVLDGFGERVIGLLQWILAGLLANTARSRVAVYLVPAPGAARRRHS